MSCRLAVEVVQVSMRPVGLPEVPEQTVAVAWAAFPKGSLATRVRDHLAEVFTDEPFVKAFGVRGAPGVLSLVTVLQFADTSCPLPRACPAA